MAASVEDEDEMNASNSVEEAANGASEETNSVETILSESSQLVADSLGIELLQRKAAAYLSKDVIFKVKLAIQNAERFRRKARRSRMSGKDVLDALSLQSGESPLGIASRDFVPVKGAPGAEGSKDIFVCEDDEIDLNDILQSSLPKYPAECHMKCHWLVVDGKQPSVPENPLMVDHPKQTKAALSSTPSLPHHSTPAHAHPNNSTLSSGRKANANGGTSTNNQQTTSSSNCNASHSVVKTKPFRFHELSLEQQLYFKEITEACMNTNEERKSEALASLSTDPGLHALLPRFSAFITHGVRLNVIHRSLAILIYLMRMLSALINNPNISLEKYLHELIPSVFTCIVNRQLVDQHWALRSFAARCLASLCQKYSNNVNNLLPRSVNVLKQALSEMNTIGFPTLYGVVCALGELGHETMRSTLLPQVKLLGNLIQDTRQQCARREYQQRQQSMGGGGGGGPGGANNSSSSSFDGAEDAVLNKGAQELETKMTKVLAAYIISEMTDLTEFNDFKVHFGYLGPVIYNEVSRLRQQQQTQTSSSSAVAYVSPSTLRVLSTNSNNSGGNVGATGTQGVLRHNVAMATQRMVPRVSMPQQQPQQQHQQNIIQGVQMSQGMGAISQGRRVISSNIQLGNHPPNYFAGQQPQFMNGSMQSATSPPDVKDFQISQASGYMSVHPANQQMMQQQHHGNQISPNAGGIQFISISANSNMQQQQQQPQTYSFNQNNTR